ncbi:hypothetical protein OIU77_016884 [Salix suchowensis]|uniref:Uncharacterized protein n=1 Tax=Salix suchowensis TaxID=1278906 RepID=A0ABQ8ZLX5_9ROSI|nr:hypothetical protein OIU77_016884 [Salix suchowensis]
MAASFLSSSALTVQSQATATRRLVVASAARGNEVEKVRLNHEIKKDGSNGRRDMMFRCSSSSSSWCLLSCHSQVPVICIL